MTNKIFLTGLGAVLLSSTTAYAACTTMPTCAELGYSTASCATGESSISCPFDKSYKKCIRPCDTSIFTLNSCPTTSNCETCQGKYRVISCKTGYRLNAQGTGCEVNPCEGYALNSCPANAYCGSCKSGANTKYKVNYCNGDYAYVGWGCTHVSNLKVGDPYYYNGQRIGTIFAVAGKKIGPLSITSPYTMAVGDYLGETQFSDIDPVKAGCFELGWPFTLDLMDTKSVRDALVDNYPLNSCSATIYPSVLIDQYKDQTGYTGWSIPTVGQAYVLLQSGIVSIQKDTMVWTKEGSYGCAPNNPNCDSSCSIFNLDSCDDWGVAAVEYPLSGPYNFIPNVSPTSSRAHVYPITSL